MTADVRQAWIDGEPIEGVVHDFHEYVRIADGPEAGHYGYVMSLVTVKPEVVFMVELRGSGFDVPVPQRSLVRIT